jgi:hypothetical protein
VLNPSLATPPLFFFSRLRRSDPLRVRSRLVVGAADAVFEGIKEKYTEAMARDDVKAIVLTGERSRLNCAPYLKLSSLLTILSTFDHSSYLKY